VCRKETIEKYIAQIWQYDHWQYWAGATDYIWLYTKMKEINDFCPQTRWRIIDQEGNEI
jgi:hypothetical protein